MRIVEANDWKDAAITLLEPRSPYRPWRSGPEPLRAGERVLGILPTDPVSVLAAVGDADARGNVRFDACRSFGLVDATTLALVADIPSFRDPRRNCVLDESTADDIEAALEEHRYFRDSFMRHGHTSLAAARIILHSRGICDGCDKNIGLRGFTARDRIHTHTVDPPARDGRAPGLARSRVQSMPPTDERQLPRLPIHASPAMPRVRRSAHVEEAYGMPVEPNSKPWASCGCCVSDEKWTCSECGHQW